MKRRIIFKIPELPGDRQLYGDALPPRLNPQGSGRNMSLFLVMRRYFKIEFCADNFITTSLFKSRGISFLSH